VAARGGSTGRAGPDPDLPSGRSSGELAGWLAGQVPAILAAVGDQPPLSAVGNLIDSQQLRLSKPDSAGSGVREQGDQRFSTEADSAVTELSEPASLLLVRFVVRCFGQRRDQPVGPSLQRWPLPHCPACLRVDPIYPTRTFRAVPSADLDVLAAQGGERSTDVGD